MYLFQRIEEVTVQFKDARRTIGDFLLKYRYELKNMTMDEIAKATYTSKASLVRFAKLLGYSGWKEFMYAFAHETVAQQVDAEELVDPNFPFSKDSNTLEIIESLKNLTGQSITDTINQLEVASLDKAAKTIWESDRVVIYGTSPNIYYAELFKRKLLGIRKNAIVAKTGETGLISQSLTSKDCAIMISYSGNNPDRDPTANVKFLYNNRVPLIGITSGGKNYLRDYADIVLTISSRERLYSKITSFATEESIMFILNILYAQIFSLNYDDNVKLKISNSKILEPQRQSNYRDISEQSK